MAETLAEYLTRLISYDPVWKDVSDLVLLAWKRIQQAVPGLPESDASAGENEGVYLIWETEDQTMDLEIFRDSPAEFFYCNESTPELWECEWRILDPVPTEAVERLRRFVVAPEVPEVPGG